MHDSIPLPLAMLIIFGSAKLLAELFERLGQPGIVGEILAGALVGPSLLGWIQPNEMLKALSDLGVMFLLFGVGLEVKASELLKVGGKATLVATLGVIVPFFAGWGILSLWGAPQVEAVFVGAARPLWSGIAELPSPLDPHPGPVAAGSRGRLAQRNQSRTGSARRDAR